VGRAAAGGTLRLAVFEAGLTRAGPGLLLRDLLAGEAQAMAAAAVVAAAGADVVLLTSFDYDAGGRALAAFADRLAAAGEAYPHRFALRPNRGMATALDLDGDGRTGGAGDAQGWGWFAGQRGMALLSRLPLAAGGARDFSAFAWADLPGAALAPPGGPPPPAGVLAAQRLASAGAWEVPVVLPGGGALRILAFAAGLPYPGSADDRPARRNGDEVRFWRHLLAGALPMPPPAPPFVIMATTNLDPGDGAGRQGAMAALLADPGLRDPRPASAGAALAGGGAGGGADGPPQRGPPALDTARFAAAGGPGNLRLDYVLPWVGLAVAGAGVLWPPPGDPLEAAVTAAGRHRLVWVDIRLP